MGRRPRASRYCRKFVFNRLDRGLTRPSGVHEIVLPCPGPVGFLIGRLAGQTPDACPQVGPDVLLRRFWGGLPVER